MRTRMLFRGFLPVAASAVQRDTNTVKEIAFRA